MEKIDLKIPNLGEAESTEIIEVNIKPGEQVSINDPLIVLESEKAAMEIPSDYEGEIKEVLIQQGDEVNEGMVFARIEVVKKQEDDQKDIKPIQTEDIANEEDEPAIQPKLSLAEGVNAGPAVRKYARELEINLKLIAGTGNNGRITKNDLKKFIHNKASNEQIYDYPTTEELSKYGEIKVQKLTTIQKYASINLSKAWRSIPHVTHFEEVDITEINKVRKHMQVSPLAFLINALSKNLQNFPVFNSSLLENNKLAIKQYINIGIAVDTPDGLVVPVIKNADDLDIKEIDTLVKELANKALNKKLLKDDFEGATFTISSLGKIGGVGFTPIINPPQVGIVGVSKSQKKLYLENKKIIEKDILPISLSYDHRVINGADAGRFMESFKHTIEAT